jgi:hypothetical protein
MCTSFWRSAACTRCHACSTWWTTQRQVQYRTDQLFGRVDKQNLKLDSDADSNRLVGFGKGPLLRAVGMHAAARRALPGRLSAATHCEFAAGDSGGRKDARASRRDTGRDAGAAAPRAAVTTPLPGHTDKAEEGWAGRWQLRRVRHRPRRGLRRRAQQ